MKLHGKRPSWLPETRVGWLNVLILQWLFMRLGREINIEDGTFVRWRWMPLVVPLTGWWSDYIMIKVALSNGGVTDKDKLWDLCAKFVKDNKITCSEAIHDRHWIAYDLIEGICEAVGFHLGEEDPDE